jgi:two-component system response regulator HydG
VLARDPEIDIDDLPEPVRASSSRAGMQGQIAALGLEGRSLTVPLGTTMDDIELRVIRETLRHTKGDKNLAATLLGIAARTIYRKLEKETSGQ